MQKQSSRIYYRGKDHKDVFFRGNYHCAMYLRGELVWEKYLDGVWVFNVEAGILRFKIKTLDPIRKKVKDQKVTNAQYMTCSNNCYIVYTFYSIAKYNQTLYISNIGGNRLKNCSSLLTRNFQFAAALNDRILVCDSGIIYEVRYNKRNKNYELFEIYSDGLPEGFYAYTSGRKGAYLVGCVNQNNITKFMAFGNDNIFKEFASAKVYSNFSCCQDNERVYVIAYIKSTVYPYLEWPKLYVYDGKTTAEYTYAEGYAGKFVTGVAMIMRNGKLIIYEIHDDGKSNYYIAIGTIDIDDFSKIKWKAFEKCTVPFPDGFQVLFYNVGYITYHKVAFVADPNRVTVDDDTYKVVLPIGSIKEQIPVYYESGKINHDRDDMCLLFTISGFDQSVPLVAYIDNLYFEESEGNFGK